MKEYPKFIQIFNKVRDLPYHCPENLNDKNYTCWGKHRILYTELKKLGYKVRFRVCSFKWSELKLQKEIYRLAPKDLDKHLYLEIFLNNRWIILDCSDDYKLPRYNIWDGKSDCKLEVKAIHIFSPAESITIEREMKKDFKIIIKKYKQLYKSINSFLSKIRE